MKPRRVEISDCVHCDLSPIIQAHMSAGTSPGEVGNAIAQCVAEIAKSAVRPEDEANFVSSFASCLEKHLLTTSREEEGHA